MCWRVKWSSRAPRGWPRWSTRSVATSCLQTERWTGRRWRPRRFEMTSRAVCSTESCTRWSPGADPRSSRRFRGTRLWSKIFHCWWNPGWRHCFRWWWWCTPTSSYGCDGWSSNAAWPKPTPGLGSLRRPATSSVVPSPTSGWTTRAAQRIWCGGPATSGTRASSPSRTTWPNVRLRARRLGWCRRIQAGRIRRGASSTG
ncbi:Uncharacterised protein [Mycobacterium tuberculosis]|nr:Uncharacterised protein [Mycobacterium tuberculosis]